MSGAAPERRLVPPVPLPPGLLPGPELGEGVVGARLKPSAQRWAGVRGGAWATLTVVGAVLAVESVTALGGFVIGLVVTLTCGTLAALNLAPALHGARPALTIDPDQVNNLVPLSRVSVRLEAITRIRPLRRELLVEARGGVVRRGRVTRERWAALSGVHRLEVTREDLVAYLSARAAAVRPVE